MESVVETNCKQNSRSAMMEVAGELNIRRSQEHEISNPNVVLGNSKCSLSQSGKSFTSPQAVPISLPPDTGHDSFGTELEGDMGQQVELLALKETNEVESVSSPNEDTLINWGSVNVDGKTSLSGMD